LAGQNQRSRRACGRESEKARRHALERTRALAVAHNELGLDPSSGQKKTGPGAGSEDDKNRWRKVMDVKTADERPKG